jgi:hypothetical protein
MDTLRKMRVGLESLRPNSGKLEQVIAVARLDRLFGSPAPGKVSTNLDLSSHPTNGVNAFLRFRLSGNSREYTVVDFQRLIL